MKKKTLSHTDEIKHHLSALSEDFQSRVQVIGEQFSDLKNDINGIKKTLNSHGEILESHSKILESHTEMIGQVLVDLAEVKSELKQKVSFSDFAKLEKRVAHLEARH